MLGIQYFCEAEQSQQSGLSPFWNTTNDFGFLILPPMLQSNYPQKVSISSETAKTFFALFENAPFCSSGFGGQVRIA